MKSFTLASLFAVAIAASLSAGCTTEAFCFDECAGKGGSGNSSNNGGEGATGGGILQGGEGNLINTGGQGAAGPCEQTNGGIEICDGLDNDCDGNVDNADDIDFTDPKTCGTCSNNCYQILLNNDPDTITCTPSDNPGVDPGTCEGTCADDYHDSNGDGICEYYCVQSANDDVTCDNLDDDCDNLYDEDVNRCDDIDNCGKCGSTCVVGHGTAACVNDGNMPCNAGNTQCQIDQCDPGWHDIDNSYATGCEYACTPTVPATEVCDGVDNDCDGLIDAADDLSGDPAVGIQCFGDPDGLCAMAPNAGVSECVGANVVCNGPNVIVENQVLETCNDIDDDCDGLVDDDPIDAGSACGISNIFPCQLGTEQCGVVTPGVLTCVGNVDPGTEVCNGVDDDCDGGIDLVSGNPPPDSVGACNVPPAPPNGATQPCQAGALACNGGVVVCNNSIVPPNPPPNDTCGDDTNCDGVLDNQPDFNNDPNFCGSCDTDPVNLTGNCSALFQNATVTCNMGVCESTGCLPGFFDLDMPPDGICEYACIFNQAQEICNGFDDNCDGNIDEVGPPNGVVSPSPVQECGVSPSAFTPECTTGITVTCNPALPGFECTFPANVCQGGCGAQAELCDTLDNDCDGAINEDYPNWNKPCASDDGDPPPGDGACRTQGTFVCVAPAQPPVCNAVAADCNNLPGGCTELCDNIDNDCDGSVDEPYDDPGTNPTFYYAPQIVDLGGGTWMHAYEASRPLANGTTPGSGNGYWDTAPAGTTLDATPACSEQGRIPWFNVTPDEVEQTCSAMGGRICDLADWQNACRDGVSCDWSYAPNTSACTTPYTGSKFCNLSPSYDFDTMVGGIQDGLLVTGSPNLMNCSRDIGGDDIFDLTGNLREITSGGSGVYHLMGGAFNSASDLGATCDFDFYAVDIDFKLFDTGFRCCFDNDPT